MTSKRFHAECCQVGKESWKLLHSFCRVFRNVLKMKDMRDNTRYQPRSNIGQSIRNSKCSAVIAILRIMVQMASPSLVSQSTSINDDLSPVCGPYMWFERIYCVLAIIMSLTWLVDQFHDGRLSRKHLWMWSFSMKIHRITCNLSLIVVNLRSNNHHPFSFVLICFYFSNSCRCLEWVPSSLSWLCYVCLLCRPHSTRVLTTLSILPLRTSIRKCWNLMKFGLSSSTRLGVGTAR